jgi:hypothetical protein
MVVIGIIFVILGGVLIYWNISYSPYKAKFTQEMESRANDIKESMDICTEKEIDKLPEPLQRYSAYIGLENFRKYQVVRTVFKNTKFVFDAQIGKVLDMDYDLWLFYDKPYRSAYCTSSMYGIPFDGVDYCTKDKEGGMKGVIGKAIQIFDVRDKQGYKAGLISWLAESVAINPSALLSPYVTYEPIDDLHVKATVAYNGVSGTGVFTFNEEGAIKEFYSDERQVEKVNGVPTAVGWRCEYEDYEEKGDIRKINTVRCVKVFPDKEVVYFESDDFFIRYIK